MALKSFPLDFIRQIIEQTLLEEHHKNPTKYFGGANQVNLFSFYEQLQKDEEVNRYVEIYNDLVNQQNRTGLIMNGVLLSPENPTITNLNQCLIIPMTFTGTFRCKIGDRDLVLETINHMIELLKGRKVDVAELNNGTLFKVGTMANNVNGSPYYTNGDFIGYKPYMSGSSILSLDSYMTNRLNALTTQGLTNVATYPQWFYYGNQSSTGVYSLSVAYKEDNNSTWTKIVDDGSYSDVIFPQENTSFTPYKVSLSFDSIRVDEPRTLNGNEYCNISFGGSATIVSKDVLLGNELTKLGIKKTKIVASTDITITGTQYWLEPLELPSGANAGTQVSQLLSNKFITNSHTDNLTISNQYTFMLDMSVDLLKQWFKYARYGTQANGTTITYDNGITPNMIYEIKEIWSSWGNVDICTFNAKIVESIDIENTESDSLTISIPFQVQGVNN